MTAQIVGIPYDETNRLYFRLRANPQVDLNRLSVENIMQKVANEKFPPP